MFQPIKCYSFHIFSADLMDKYSPYFSLVHRSIYHTSTSPYCTITKQASIVHIFMVNAAKQLSYYKPWAVCLLSRHHPTLMHYNEIGKGADDIFFNKLEPN